MALEKGNKTILYPFAFDENNKRVFIGDIEKEHRHDHTYKCPDCGTPMLPRLGEKNIWHFYHSGNHSCDKESYIHAVAKGILADRFNDRTKPFKIRLKYYYRCKKRESCKWYKHEGFSCIESRNEEFDLHDTYDLPAREEIWLKDSTQSIFRPDVVLESSSSKHNPIFLEVYHKHKCSDNKKQSGHHIIEISVNDFSDLVSLQDLELEPSERITFHNFKDIEKEPMWFREIAKIRAKENDLKLDEMLPLCFSSKDRQRPYLDLWRYILYPSGKSFAYGIFEDEADRHISSALADITYDRTKNVDSFTLRELLISCLPKNLRACHLCCHIRYNNDETNCWCHLVKNGSKKKGTFNNKKGQSCPFFNSDLVPSSVDPQLYSIWINPKML